MYSRYIDSVNTGHFLFMSLHIPVYKSFFYFHVFCPSVTWFGTISISLSLRLNITKPTLQMSILRPFNVLDMLKFNNVNFDPLTETYGFNFYLQYLINWPEYFQVLEHPTGKIMGYIMGKAEGRNENWHGHVTAVSIDPEFRRMKLGAKLMYELEDLSERKKCYFVDLFVRVSNLVAVATYKSFGYSIYREIIDYYSGGAVEENAFDMRKALSMDVEKKSVIPLARPVPSHALD